MSTEHEIKAFSSFRVLNGDGDIAERDQLFRNMGQLFSYVSERCDDEQVAQYDEVLCKLAALVEVEARTHVAKLLSKLDRAPGMVVVKLAHDEIEVAQPLLEFSKVLSDDDLIDIVTHSSEQHRAAIANRDGVGGRVGEALVEHGDNSTIIRLVRNQTAQLGSGTVERILLRAAGDVDVTTSLRNRDDIDWHAMGAELSSAGADVMRKLRLAPGSVESQAMQRASTVAYARLRNKSGFDAKDWKVAMNQVKALNDRRQLDDKALNRFVRFGYGHHAACGLTLMLGLTDEMFVKWLATQDYSALIIALRALDFSADNIEALFDCLPWRDLPTPEDCTAVRSRFEALGIEEGRELFQTWRQNAVRRGNRTSRLAGAA